MSEVSLERALEFVRSHPASVHFAVAELAGNFKVRSSVNNHCVYLHKSRGADLTGPLRKVDTTLPVLGQPGTRQSPPNGSISALLDPTLEALDRFLPMLGDAALAGTRRKPPRPFQVRAVPATAPRPRSQTVRPAVEPVPVSPLHMGGEHASIRPGTPLTERLVAIWDGARRAKRRSISDISDRLREMERGEGDPAGATERDDLTARKGRLSREVSDLTERIDAAREPEEADVVPSEEEEHEAVLADGRLRGELAEEGVLIPVEVERPAFVDIAPEEEL